MPTDVAEAFWVTAPGTGELRRETLPTATQDEVTVKTLHSGLSRGTESLVFRGEVPASEYDRMRAPFQAGEFPGPVKYGYASVGRVETGPAALKGKTVFCLYPHQTRYVVPAGAVHPVPDAVPAGRAVLAANLETAINAVWDAEMQPGERVAVIGAGTVGVLTAWCARRLAGCEVTLIDINPRRAAIADAFGLSFATPEQASGLSQQLNRIFHTSATEPGLRLALELAAFEATIIEMSWYGTRAISLPLGRAFHALRLTLKSSQVGSVATSRRGTVTADARLAYALSLLDEPVLDTLINSECDFKELPARMQQIANAPGDVLCHRINYP